MTARHYSDRKEKHCILQVRLKGLLASRLVSSSIGFSETGQQNPSHGKHHLSQQLWRIHLEVSFRKVYRTHPRGDTIACSQILFHYHSDLKKTRKVGLRRFFHVHSPLTWFLTRRYMLVMLQCATRASSITGNCSDMAELTNNPPSQISFLCLPITARQRGGSEVCCGSAGCCEKGRQMGRTVVLRYL